jgi:uncharacterized protein YjbI with pentapeptide repeats
MSDNCSLIVSDEPIEYKVFTKCSVKEKEFDGKIFKGCTFREVNFEDCFFDYTKFINCVFYNVSFTRCDSTRMVIKKCKFFDSLISVSKFELTKIVKTDFTDFRFYNTVFLKTEFFHINITKALFENSSFVQTSIMDLIIASTSIISTDFRDSLLQGMYFEFDVDIQESNFSDSEFFECDFGSAHITETIFDNSEFNKVSYVDNSMILNSSFENVTYTNTNVIATSTPQDHSWPEVVTDIEMSEVSQRPLTLSGSLSRGLPVTLRFYVHPEDILGYIPLHLEPSTTTPMPTTPTTPTTHYPRDRIDKPNINFAIKNVDIPVTQNAMELFIGETQLLPHLTENTDDVAFFFRKHYYIASRENILRMISDSTENEKKDNSIVYECIEPDSMNPKNIIKNAPLVKLASLGLHENGVYIDIKELQLILDETRRHVKNRIYELIPTEEVVKSVVSYQVLNHLTDDWYGASHCQKGQSGTIFKIRKVRNAAEMVSNAIRQGTYKSRKSKTNGGKTKINKRKVLTRKRKINT